MREKYFSKTHLLLRFIYQFSATARTAVGIGAEFESSVTTMGGIALGEFLTMFSPFSSFVKFIFNNTESSSKIILWL